MLLSKFEELRMSGDVMEPIPPPENQRGTDEADLVQVKMQMTG